MNGITGNLGARLSSSGLSSFIPEPRNRNQGTVSSIASGFGSLLSGAASTLGGGLGGGALNYESLLQTQERLNFQNLYYSTMSNVQKAEHDTRTSITRNMRVS